MGCDVLDMLQSLVVTKQAIVQHKLMKRVIPERASASVGRRRAILPNSTQLLGGGRISTLIAPVSSTCTDITLFISLFCHFTGMSVPAEDSLRVSRYCMAE